MHGLRELTNKSTRLEQLKELLEIIADAIDKRPGARDLSQLSKQYRETLKEIEEIEGEKHADNDIANLLRDRKSAGRAGSVRKGRAGV